MKEISCDILIVGGGIAGLWSLHALSRLGYSVVLCEKSALGTDQTIKSQGIIHGGLKYALAGTTNAASAALSDMPTRWQQCLNGTGEIDLRAVEILSAEQYMWSTTKLAGSLAALLASKALKSHVCVANEQPEVLRNSAIKSKLYSLSEIVLNVPSLLDALARPYLAQCIQAEYNRDCKITAQKYIFTAGQGNAAIYQHMQLRPLHMVMVKSKQLAKLYGHCVAMGTLPRITITTHIAHDGVPVWYLGGKLAEDGVNLDQSTQIKKAQQELADIFPQLDLHNANWASFLVDRAEAKQPNGTKPDSATVLSEKDKIIAWPTKLALAPVLADQICAILKQENIKPKYPMPDLSGFPKAQIATPIWDQSF